MYLNIDDSDIYLSIDDSDMYLNIDDSAMYLNIDDSDVFLNTDDSDMYLNITQQKQFWISIATMVMGTGHVATVHVYAISCPLTETT